MISDILYSVEKHWLILKLFSQKTSSYLRRSIFSFIKGLPSGAIVERKQFTSWRVWGWLKKDNILLPKLMTFPPAPLNLLKIIKCNCKTECAATSHCSYRKNDIKCTSICGNCKGVSRLNHQEYPNFSNLTRTLILRVPCFWQKVVIDFTLSINA